VSAAEESAALDSVVIFEGLAGSDTAEMPAAVLETAAEQPVVLDTSPERSTAPAAEVL
jgi:hypothetical protein